MKKWYFTFGQAHAHSIGGVTYDKDCVVEIEADTSVDARKIMFDTFGDKWAFGYDTKPQMKYFPRGIIKLGTKT